MFVTVLLLLVSAAAIYFACEYFVNAIEWLGARMKMGTIAIGSVLAAIGTALPESVVTLVAVVFGEGEDRKQIGIGAAMGGPLALSTIAYATVGFVLFLRHRSARIHPPGAGELREDQLWFLVLFVVKLGLGLFVLSWKPWLAIFFLLAYAVYVHRELRASAAGEVHDTEDLEPLALAELLKRPATPPPTWATLVQTVATLAVIFGASQVFVNQIELLGPQLGMAPATTALLLSPIATELPEVVNAIIWVRAGKTSMALANVAGSMMIQATIPSAIGIAFTPWVFTTPVTIAGVVTLVSVLLLFATGKRLTSGVLMAAGAMYLVFATGVLLTI